MGITGTQSIFCSHIKGVGYWLTCENGEMPRFRVGIERGSLGFLYFGLTRRLILVACSSDCLAMLEKIEAQAYRLGQEEN